ncbi:MAG TPA: hypothetical protein VGC45_15795 [Gryllotalpicola sp.]
MLTAYVAETITGKNLGPLPAQTRSWATSIDGKDTLQVNLPFAAIGKQKDWMRLITTPVRSTLILDWDGRIVAAGPIWTRQRSTSAVSLGASGLLSIFARRKVHTWSQPYAAAVMKYAGMSLGSIAAELGKLATAATKGTSMALPVIWPADEPDDDADNTRTYYGYDLAYVADRWAELTGVINGPDIYLQPEWTSTQRTAMRWRARIGTKAQPMITSSAKLTWNVSQPRSSVRGFTASEDASNLAAVQWSRGTGTDTDTLIARATDEHLLAVGYPALEGEIDYTTVQELTTLQRHASGDLAIDGSLAEQFNIAVAADQAPLLGTYQLGDYASIVVKGDPWVPDSPSTGYRRRLIGLSGDATPIVTLQLQ